MSTSNLKHWLSRGDLDKLENVVLEGKGSRLLGEYSSDLRTRVFLKGLPNYLMKISQIHDATERGSLSEVQRIVDSEPKKKLVLAKDPVGTPLIHKAVYYDHQNILEWILRNYPSTVEQKDREGRTGLFYCAACREPELVWEQLLEAGCDASICDRRSRPAAYYLQHGAPGSELELPEPPDRTMPARSRRQRGRHDPAKWLNGLDFKPSNIRIWIHNRDIGKLQHVLWEGHGSKLRCETSNNVRVKRFLEAVPFIMVTIKDIHSAVIKNDIDGFRQKLDEPIPPIILCSKDSNGLNVLHKAAGLGYADMAREVLERYPATMNAPDNDGRTPLHYAAVCRDAGAMYDLLLEYGADESKTDNRQKTAAFYKSRPADLDLASLVGVPEAPRVSSSNYPRHWDWRIIDSDMPARPRRARGPSSEQSSEQSSPSAPMPEGPDAAGPGAGDDDSAFGSAESAKELTEEEAASPEIENADEELKGKEDDGNGAEATEGEDVAEVKDEETGEPEEENEPAADDNNNNNDEEEEEKDEGENEDGGGEKNEVDNGEEEEPVAEEEEEEEQQPAPADEAEEESGEAPADEENSEQPEQNNNPEEQEAEPAEEGEGKGQEEEEKPEPSTADSGLADMPSQEEQIANESENVPDEEEEEEEEEEQEEEQEEREEQEEPQQAEAGAEPEPEPEPESEEPGHGPGMAVDEETDRLVESGTMEQLAALVLTGEGDRLVGRHSSNPELKAFIDNVPVYMSKIRAVHKAAREGNLKDLQISLDRRKFAIAKDRSSPHGATPLHVAVIFGHTPVVRYLAGRFPETAHALDYDGRTPLHYAAVLADNGHYYNLLLHLGANPLVQDNFGHKAEYYKQHQDDLSHKQLLRDFGASESLADEMLVDKDLKIFQDEEGRYLASSLGDPLIKGLTEVATNRPRDPVTYLATYLYNFASQDKAKEKTEDSNILIISEERTEEQEEKLQSNEENEKDDGYPQSPDLDSPESLFAETERDENGQSSLHFAANRTHSKDGLYHLLQERQINIALRDSRYRTGRDIAEQSRNHANVREIDRFVVYLAARGETDKLVELLLEGYDHILDTEDEGKNIIRIAEEEGNESTVKFLQSINNYIAIRDEIHQAIRKGDALRVRELLEMNGDGAGLLALGKNATGRSSLHIAVLREYEDIVRYIAKNHPDTLRLGDNLERTALHYAMGVPSVEVMSGILIKAGAKRVQKDLKSRQPTYYFMNKSDIKQLQDEEELIAQQ